VDTIDTIDGFCPRHGLL